MMALGKLLISGEVNKDFVAFVRKETGAYTNKVALSSDKGSTFTEVGSNLNHQDIAMSYSGKYLLTCAKGEYMYLSKDYGANWTQKGESRDHTSCVMSIDGKYQFTVGTARYFRSTDYGENFTASNFSGAIEIACSASGQYVTVIQSSAVYVSDDYGATWTGTSLSDNLSVSMSETGQYQVIGRSAFCYTSEDYGETWTQLGSPAPAGMRSIAMSLDGSGIFGINSDAWVYYSTNWWETWYSFAVSSNAGNWCIAASYNSIGQSLLYCAMHGDWLSVTNFNDVSTLTQPENSYAYRVRTNRPY